MNTPPPLAGLRAVATARGVAATYAARMLATLGADVVLVEPEAGSPLRREPPFLPGGETSALFAYLAAGLRSLVADLTTVTGRVALGGLLAQADVLIDDTPLAEREAAGLGEATIAAAHPDLVHVSVLAFGAHGPKAGWKAEDIIVQHASGEGNLLPNGLSVELFPDRAPVKIHGHFAEMQGGIAAALGALSALWARDEAGGQFVDISSQDAGLAVGAFAIQRLGDGSIEHRVERSFRYGGVLPCADGFVELLTLEQRQWDGLVDLLGRPEWATDPALADSLERSRRGPELNRHIRAWTATRRVEDIVREGQKLSVPLAKYYSPLEVVKDEHERVRGLFQPVDVDAAGMLDVLVSPFHVDGAPLHLRSGPPALGETNRVDAAS
jgi:crotonobetainyl-CoA:carnitine CoA-transferase CaiB-like acyl-CoA transferase